MPPFFSKRHPCPPLSYLNWSSLPQSTLQSHTFPHWSSCSAIFFTMAPSERQTLHRFHPPLLPTDSGFARGLGWFLCRRGRKELIRLLFVVAFGVLLWERNLTRQRHTHTQMHTWWEDRTEWKLRNDWRTPPTISKYTRTHMCTLQSQTQLDSHVWVCVCSLALCSSCVRTRVFEATPLLCFCFYSQGSSVFWLAVWYLRYESVFFLISSNSDLTNSAFPAVGRLARSCRRWKAAAQANRSYDGACM